MKNTTVIIGGVVLVLAGAAFVGVRLFSGQDLPWLSLGRQGFSLGGGNSNGVHIDRDDIQPTKELPQTPEDVWGLFDHRRHTRLRSSCLH